MRSLSGIGAYPTDPCYDPDRPSWLPYWLDDFTESDCKYNATNIGGAVVGAIENPGQVATNVGGVIGQGAGAAVGDVASGVAAGVTGAANATVSNLTLGGSAVLIGGILLAALVGVMIVSKEL